MNSLNGHLNQIKNGIGLVSGTLDVNEYNDVPENVSAHIEPDTWHIDISLKSGFNPASTHRQSAYVRKKKIADAKKQLLEDILYHELGHWELPFNSGFGCPFDAYNHDLILEAVKTTLPKEKQQHASYVANAFEDLLNNARCKQYTKNFAGQVLFFEEQGIKSGAEGYTPIYEAHVRLNMFLWGDSIDTALLKRHYKKEERVNNAIDGVIKALNLKESQKDLTQLFEKERWSALASAYTRAVAPLLDIAPKEKLSAFSGSNDEESEKEDGEKTSMPAGSGVEEEARTDGGKENIIAGRYNNGKKPSTNIDQVEQFDIIYATLAKQIPIQVEATTREHSFPITYIRHRAFDPDRDKPSRVKQKLILGEEGPTLGVSHDPLSIHHREKIQHISFPDFKLLILDSSESMNHGVECNGSDSDKLTCNGSTTFIPWGDESRYHYAMLGLYGIDAFLKAQSIAQSITHGLTVFSGKTVYKEGSYRELPELYKLALSPEFSGTNLNQQAILDALRPGKSFVLSISDGEIQNWESIKKDFLELAAENYFAHIHLGPKNTFTKALEKLDETRTIVYYPKTGDDFSLSMVVAAKSTYQRFIHQ